MYLPYDFDPLQNLMISSLAHASSTFHKNMASTNKKHWKYNLHDGGNIWLFRLNYIYQLVAVAVGCLVVSAAGDQDDNIWICGPDIQNNKSNHWHAIIRCISVWYFFCTFTWIEYDAVHSCLEITVEKWHTTSLSGLKPLTLQFHGLSVLTLRKPGGCHLIHY